MCFYPNDDVKPDNENKKFKYNITRIEHCILDMGALHYEYQEMGASDHNGIWATFLVE